MDRKRFALLALPGLVVTLAVVFLVFFSPFSAPCLSLSAPPSGVGPPSFPPSGTTDFSSSWCLRGSQVMHLHPALTIVISGTTVFMRAGIGENSSYPGGGSCTLPLHTHPSADFAGQPNGTIHVESSWAYSYTLGDFFAVWAATFPTVFVNASFPTQPVAFNTTSILGFQSSTTDHIRLFVDGKLSDAGAALDITKLDFAPHPSPLCFEKEYGSGHVIEITYGP